MPPVVLVVDGTETVGIVRTEVHLRPKRSPVPREPAQGHACHRNVGALGQGKGPAHRVLALPGADEDESGLTCGADTVESIAPLARADEEEIDVVVAPGAVGEFVERPLGPDALEVVPFSRRGRAHARRAGGRRVVSRGRQGSDLLFRQASIPRALRIVALAQQRQPDLSRPDPQAVGEDPEYIPSIAALTGLEVHCDPVLRADGPAGGERDRPPDVVDGVVVVLSANHRLAVHPHALTAGDDEALIETAAVQEFVGALDPLAPAKLDFPPRALRGAAENLDPPARGHTHQVQPLQFALVGHECTQGTIHAKITEQRTSSIPEQFDPYLVEIAQFLGIALRGDREVFVGNLRPHSDALGQLPVDREVQALIDGRVAVGAPAHRYRLRTRDP